MLVGVCVGVFVCVGVVVGDGVGKKYGNTSEYTLIPPDTHN